MGESPETVCFEPMDFLAAERAAEDAVEAVLTEGGEKLFQAYIDRKSFPFASQAATDLVRQELQMCFVRHDGGEPCENDDLWTLEPEPQPNLSDTWSRACVPIRKKYITKNNLVDDSKTGRRGRVKGSNISGNSPPSKTGGLHSSTETDVKAGAARSQMIPLIEEREEDEEESAMRDMKDREAKRKREEEARLARKAQDEAEEAARLAQVKDQMKNKPYTYDSEGNIIWIQPVSTERLPNANPSLNFSLKKIAQKNGEEEALSQKFGGKTPKKSTKKKGRKEPEFSDSFKKLVSQQPPMIDTMSMAPGVLLSERGRSKKGHNLDSKEKGKMTRRDYLQMVQTSGAGNTFDMDGSMASPLDAPQSARDADMVAASFDQDGGGPADALGQNDAFNMAIVTSTDWGNNPAAPGEPRPVQPAPPPAVHNLKMKRDAVGYGRGVRDRIPRSGTSGMGAYHRPQPPVGATMGHGLLPKGSKHEEFYFPHSPAGAGAGGGGLANLSESEEEVADPQTARDPHGMIQTENKQLIQRLFR